MKEFIIAFLLISSLTFSQERKLGNVTVEELKEKASPIDTSAAAAYLFKKSNVAYVYDFGWRIVTTTEVKIKIYKKEGYDYANFQQSFYSGKGSAGVVIKDAVTYNLVDGKVEKTKLGKEGEFIVKKSKYYSTKKISMPNVKVGSIIEYKHISSTGPRSQLADFYFQYSIPVKYIEYRVSQPEYYLYNNMFTGSHTPLFKKETAYISQSAHTISTYTLTDVKPIKEEEFVNNINNYRTKISSELYAIRDQYGNMTNYASNWPDITKDIYADEDFGEQLKKNNYFEADIDSLLVGATTRDEKISRIFDFVQTKMTWNEYYGYTCDEGVKAAYKNKMGTVAEINLMLTAMLRYAGLEANPVLVSTRDNGIALYPSYGAFDYVVAAVEIPNDVILLDASDKNARPNIMPVRALNWSGRIIRKEGSSAEIDLMPKVNSKEVFSVNATIDADGNVSGKIKDQSFDYNAYVFRSSANGLTKDTYLDKLEKKYLGLTVDEYNVANEKELSKPIIETYDFTHKNLVENTGNKMYFSPLLFLVKEKNPFLEEKREFPVDFVFPYQIKYNLSIAIPSGYVVESMPAVGIISMEEKIGSFTYNIADKGTFVQVAVQYDINYPIISPVYYETLKVFFREMIKKQNEKIVLKKV